jgi:hypothetical protein
MKRPYSKTNKLKGDPVDSLLHPITAPSSTAESVREALKKVRLTGGRLINYQSELDPYGNFRISDLEDQSDGTVDDAFIEYLSAIYGIEPEEF